MVRQLSLAAVRSLAAGADLLCFGPGVGTAALIALVDRIAAAVAAGELPLARLEQAAGRTAALAAWVAAQAAARRAGVEWPADPGRQAELGVEAARRSIRVEGAVTGLAGALVVQLHSGYSIAKGRVPWGWLRAPQRVTSDQLWWWPATVGMAAGHHAWFQLRQLLRHWPVSAPVLVLGWPRSSTSGWLPVQDSGPATVFPETTSYRSAVRLSRSSTWPISWLPVRGRLPVRPVSSTGPVSPRCSGWRLSRPTRWPAGRRAQLSRGPRVSRVRPTRPCRDCCGRRTTGRLGTDAHRLRNRRRQGLAQFGRR